VAESEKQNHLLPAWPEAIRSVLRVVSVVEGSLGEEAVSNIVPGTVTGLSTVSTKKSAEDTMILRFWTHLSQSWRPDEYWKVSLLSQLLRQCQTLLRCGRSRPSPNHDPWQAFPTSQAQCLEEVSERLDWDC
jgi:hypothetical protein